MATSVAKKTRHRGRIPGSKNKATLEKAMIAEQIHNRATMAQTPLAKEVLSRFMLMFAGMASQMQPSTQTVPNPNENKTEFERWARLAVDCAAKLAPYQSPTFRAIVVAPAPDPNDMNKETMFTLNIFDNRGKLIEHISSEGTDKRAGRDTDH